MFRENQLKSKLLLTVFLFIFYSCNINLQDNKRQINLGLFNISGEISNQQINCFTQDDDGFIWIGTERGLNKYNGYEYYQYFNDPKNDFSICSNSIQTLLLDHNNVIWVGTKEGICFYNNNKEEYTRVSINTDSKSVIQIVESKNGTIYANLGKSIYKYNPKQNTFYPIVDFDEYYSLNRFYIDKEENLWLISRNSIKCFDSIRNQLLTTIIPNRIPNLVYSSLLQNGQMWVIHGIGGIKIINTHLMKEIDVPKVILDHPIISKALITSVSEYSNNQLLLNTHKNGLFIYDLINNRIIDQHHPDFPFETPDVEITTLYKDNNDNLWIGSHEKGHHIIYKYKNQFNYNRSLQSVAKDNSIKCIALGLNNQIWFSTYNDHLFVYDLNKKQVITNIDLTSFFVEDPFFQDKIKDIVIDNKIIWIITDGKIIKYTYENNRIIRKKTYSIRHELLQQTIDKEGNLWVCSQDQFVFCINTSTGEFVSIPVFEPNNIYQSAIQALSNGKIMITATGQPLKFIDPSKNYLISSSDIYTNKLKFEPSTLFEDSQQNVWIGQINGPLLKYYPNENKLEEYPINNATSIIEDSKHEFWIGTLYGLSHYIPISNRHYTYYSYDGIGGNQFNIKCNAKLPDNSLIFGGTHGLTIFKPELISLNRNIPLHISSAIINNKYYYKTHIKKSNSKEYINLNLNHYENNLSIHYGAVDVSEYSRLRYYYKLEGFDKDWIDNKNNRIAHYANLKPGDYTFKVKITSNDSSSIESESYLKIHISRPPWFSWSAIALYTIFLTYIIWLILNLYSRMKMNRAKAQIAIREKEHEAYINNMNMSFFSNISHEFRTPLTIITAPISSLLSSKNLNIEEKHLINLIQRSIKRMLRLVNQLMDLSKLEADTLKLRVNRIDIKHQIRSLLELYIIYANEKNIELQTKGLEDSFFTLLDIDKLEKIIGNILSNALKFTPQYGKISFELSFISNEEAIEIFPNASNYNYKGSYACFNIEDTGTGIPEDKLEDVFKRYYQIDNKLNATFNWGTGIGLYYTKRLIDLHHGFIKAENNNNPGTTFIFIIPLEDKAYSSNEISTLSDTNISPLKTHYKNEAIDIKPEIIIDSKENFDKEKILIVDDDIEISYYLKTLLSKDYQVINKYDGKEAYESIEEIDPTLIISDVLMPGLNGYELCSKIKENIDFCHIPVILLTAKTLLEEKVEGLETGANAYVTKPFESAYLVALVKSLIKNRKFVSNILTSNTNTSSVKKEVLQPKDKIFMDNLYELFEKELGNSEMNITHIAQKMGMSRTKFYHKIKGLTNENPNSFFKKYKLNRAAELIIEGGNNMSEIADMTGFANLPHFSTSFKKQFGCNPSEYKG